MSFATRSSKLCLALALVLLAAAPARAQQSKPLPAAVLEIRGARGTLGADVVTAGDLGVTPEALPNLALGGVAGIHAYVLRRERFTLGLGGEGLLMRDRADLTDAAGQPTGQRVVRQLQGLAGIVSLNFGHLNGWSHLSAGFGPLRFKNALSPATPAPGAGAPYTLTLNAGAGARWFLSDHVAFGFDLRMYLTRSDAGSPTSAGRHRARLVIMSAGIAIK